MNDLVTRDSLREMEAVLGRRMDTLTGENAALRQRLRLTSFALGGVFFITVVLAYMMAPRAEVAEALIANQFVLRDQLGLNRAVLDIEPEGGPRLVLRDGDNRERVRISLLRDGSPGITLSDRDGRPRGVLGLLPDGTTNLVFADAAGTTRVLLGHSSAEATTLLLADRSGFTRAGLVVDSDGEGALTLYENRSSGAVEPEVLPDAPPITP